MDQEIDQLAQRVQSARRAVIFTGAGISTECGVPDFRTPGGLWDRHKPTPFKDFIASEATRLKAWRSYFEIRASFKDVAPGLSHHITASWVERGNAALVVTQNIDDLHARSGVAREQIVELHGNGTYAKCLSCGLRHELDWVWQVLERDNRPPVCRECGGLVKSATIAFGQPMPAAALAQAAEATRNADLFVVIGTSLTVYPAASLPILAAENGTALVIINRESTPLDGLASQVLNGEIASILGATERCLSNHPVRKINLNPAYR